MAEDTKDVYDLIFGVDNYDPCEAVKVIRAAYYRIIAGESVQKIEFRDRTLWNFQGNSASLLPIMRQLEAECAEQQGKTPKPRRFALVGGYRRRIF